LKFSALEDEENVAIIKTAAANNKLNDFIVLARRWTAEVSGQKESPRYPSTVWH